MREYKSWNIKAETDERALKLMQPRETIDEFVNRLLDAFEIVLKEARVR